MTQSVIKRNCEGKEIRELANKVRLKLSITSPSTHPTCGGGVRPMCEAGLAQ